MIWQEYDPVGGFPSSASDPGTEPSGKEQKRRKIHVLASFMDDHVRTMIAQGRETYVTGVEISCFTFSVQQKLEKRGCGNHKAQKKDQGFAKNWDPCLPGKSYTYRFFSGCMIK